MTADQFFRALVDASTYADALTAIEAFEAAHAEDLDWFPVGGRQNNRGIIEVSADPGHSLIERVTNGIDGVLEAEHDYHGGLPVCRTPHEAATAWLNVPAGGLSDMSPGERRKLAQRVTVRLLPGDTKAARILEVRDRGIGLLPEQMPSTILSLNESNKMQKHFLAGAYGQGGSSTFASSSATFIASRKSADAPVGFTVVHFQDLPAEEYKTGRYVYLTLTGSVLTTSEVDVEAFEIGTLAKHFGYELSGYGSPLGPTSVYGLLNQILFDPVMPIWFDNRVHDYRRVIKGSRNALNGAVDEGDEGKKGPTLSHRMPMLYVPIGEYGRIGIEYWVLERPDKANKKPTAAFVNPYKPIVLTLNGQTHEELTSVLIRKDSGRPYLAQRLICHVDCNSLTPTALRSLFVSNREGARRGHILESLKRELVQVLISDDELTRLNAEAKEASAHERDENAVQEARKAVARLLKVQGMDVFAGFGTSVTDKPDKPDKPSHPRPPRPKPQALVLHEPPTYIRLVWDENKDISFYSEQRRYLRIETDAESSYHNPNNPSASRVNIIVSNGEVAIRGSTPLQGGRMRALFDCVMGARVGGEGTIRVELSRPGLPVLYDERKFAIVEQPPAKEDKRRTALPPFEFRPVSPDDQLWTELDWPDDVNAVATSAEMEDGLHVVYYSTAFPKFKLQYDAFERVDPSQAASFEKRYCIWVTVHSLLMHHQQQQQQADQIGGQDDHVEEEAVKREREERKRMATVAAIFAAREVQSPETEKAESE